MAAIEEHKPAEKRRALGRGLDSLLPSGPRVVAAAPATAVSIVLTDETYLAEGADGSWSTSFNLERERERTGITK